MCPNYFNSITPVGLVGHYLSTGKNGVGVDLPLCPAEATQIGQRDDVETDTTSLRGALGMHTLDYTNIVVKTAHKVKSKQTRGRLRMALA